MTPISVQISRRPQQRGVSLVAGIFLLLLMSVLAAALATIVSTAHINVAADVGGAQAYQAARAGAEWGLFQLDPNGATSALPDCFADSTPAVPGHAVTVTCSRNEYTEGGRTLRIYLITSTASPTAAKAPGIERQVQVTVEKCRDPAITTAPFDC